MNFHIYDSIKEQALNHSNKRIEFEFDRFGLNLVERKSMILIGTIGQLVFKSYLENLNIKYDFEFQAGNFDEIDFKIYNKIIEIKTSGFDDYYSGLNLLYSEGQFQRGLRKGYAYCVQIFINGYQQSKKILDLERCDLAIISGYIEFSKIGNFKNQRKYYADDYKVPLKNLKSINLLISELRQYE